MKTLLTVLLSVSASAAATTTSPPSLHPQTGRISLLHGSATVQADSGLYYLDAADARSMIVDVWGNPPEVASDVLGMLVPGNTPQDSAESWGIVLTESQDGHVSDSDAAQTNYTSLLSEMQQGVEERNAERTKAGYEAIRLIGWAEPPSYDAMTHKMYWAKELAFGTDSTKQADHTLNYAVRVLGRQNVLEMNAVGSMAQLPAIRQGMKEVVQRVSFNPGSRYEDFNASTDKLATYGVAGLIAGGVVAQKVGLFALIPLLLKKGWIVIVGLLALLRRMGGMFSRRRVTQPDVEMAPAPRSAEANAAAVSTPTPQQARINLSKPGDRPLGRHES
ncbi:DUF2167 domain-containing protein [Deinococcus sp. KNUC1210]|uniref:DUF2167 domain-containing protein n=1 Tax=Deinococcus sp. KNUC1210 TaxID=2917691 RepID=UPI001EF028AC|nr:DUF2167 domain-containing protein [Deinococcus sp. KNUC1210]ULH16524.1 DUF2167 domain-containing protein [Deinococcus sp. KNUC1210]